MRIKTIKYLNLILRTIFGGLPAFVGIETQTKCNLCCEYCPNSTIKRTFREMSLEMFIKICSTLSSAGFTGALHLHGYGEPLMDNRLCDLIKIAKRLLPHSTICVATNGDLLNSSLETHLSEVGLDRLIITRHDGGRLLPIRYVGKMKVEEGPIINTIHNRCGLIKLKKVKWKRLRICTESFHPFITANGDICFCCHDYNALQGFGLNVNDNEWLPKWCSSKNHLLAVVGPRPNACRSCRIGEYK
ncbi:MAG: radical SAM protein [Thermodesulfovibrionales bacterium]